MSLESWNEDKRGDPTSLYRRAHLPEMNLDRKISKNQILAVQVGHPKGHLGLKHYSPNQDESISVS